MTIPRDPRDRLPPLLARFCPDPATVKQQSRVWAAKCLSFLYGGLTRLGKASVRGWRALDRTGRLFLACAVGLVLLTVVLPSVVLWGFAIAGLVVFGQRARCWREFDLRGRVFIACGNLASVVALALAIGGLSHKSGDETRMPNTTSTASDKGAAPQSTTSPAAPRFRYTVTDLGKLGGDTSRASGLNNNGQVVGNARASDGTERPFLWDSDRGIRDLGGLGGVYYVGSDRAGSVGSANAINDAGQVVGAAYTRETMPRQHAFLWEADRGMQDLGTLGGIDSEAFGINRKGQVIGYSRTAGSMNPHAFLWDRHGGMQDLGTLGGEESEARCINDNGQVVGSAGTSENHLGDHAFLWEAGSGMVDLGTLGGARSCAYRINNSGMVIGTADTSKEILKGSQAFVSHAFLWEHGRGMKDLGTLRPADNSVWVSGISNAGVVVGDSGRNVFENDGEDMPAAFIYERGKMSGLGSMIAPSLCRDFFPVAINDRGQIAGNGTNPAGQVHAFLLTPIPENASPSDVAALQRAPNRSPQPTAEGRTEPLTSSSKPEVPSVGRTAGRRESFRYTVTDLGTLGGDTSRANGINNHGQVVGEARTSGGMKHPFLWDGTRGMRDLRGLGRAGGPAKAINDAGQVVGDSHPEGGDLFEEHAFLWEADHGVKDLGTLGGIKSIAFGINRKGQVVGYSTFKADAYITHAFLWDARRGMQDVGTLGGEVRGSEARCINDSGQVVGFAWVMHPAFSHAFLWEAGSGMKDLGTLGSWGTATSQAHCINNSGQVVGNTSVPGGYHAFLWEAGRGMRDLGTLAERWSDALAVNNKGDVVGLIKTADNIRPDAAVLFSGSEVIDLNKVIDPASGWHLVEATGVNDVGQIIGQGRNSAGQLHAFLLTPVH